MIVLASERLATSEVDDTELSDGVDARFELDGAAEMLPPRTLDDVALVVVGPGSDSGFAVSPSGRLIFCASCICFFLSDICRMVNASCVPDHGNLSNLSRDHDR